MKNLNKEVMYTPEIITVHNGDPVRGKVIAESHSGNEYTLELDGGETIRAESRLCEIKQ